MLTQLLIWLNAIATSVANVALAPIAWLPGWLSLTLIAIVTGILMLWVFKHTSNQRAIRGTRNQIKANLLALSLFKDSLAVSLRAQGRILLHAARLLALSLGPMLVMALPMTLLLSQLSLWYQARPLRVGEDAIVTASVAEGDIDYMATTRMLASAGYEVDAGPVRIDGKLVTTASWRIVARQSGLHAIAIECDQQTYTKELAVGDGFLPVSLTRPSKWNLTAVLLNPREPPLSGNIYAIEINYPDRPGGMSGTDWWLWSWFGISLAAAFAVRPLLGVDL